MDDRAQRLIVTFKQPIPPNDQAHELLQASSYALTGGQILFPRVLSAALYNPLGQPPDLVNRRVQLQLCDIGDFSVYTLTVLSDEIDPFFASHKLRFRLDCDDAFDCFASQEISLQSAEDAVAIDYLAKDYASFRQALIEFIPTRMPAWTERSEADIGMALLELFAATADTLSYTQDRVANEAFLDSAVQRRSVAGHLQLIDYDIDQGAAAYTWLQFLVDKALQLPASQGLRVSNRPTHVDEQVVIFETHGEQILRPEHNEMQVYAWGQDDCCLPRDALSLTLVGSYPALQAGDCLLLDDGYGRRDIVRLTRVMRHVGSDAQLLTTVFWSSATPLHHDYCVRGNVVLGLLECISAARKFIRIASSTNECGREHTLYRLTEGVVITYRGRSLPLKDPLPIPAGAPVELRLSADRCKVISVTSPPPARLLVRGNLAPASHGETVTEELLPGQPPGEVASAEDAAYEQLLDRGLRLARAPLAYLNPATPGLPPISQESEPFPSQEPSGISTLALSVNDEFWQERTTLLNSSANDRHSRVEIDDLGNATIRFGTTRRGFGARPAASERVVATYRVGGGVVGNVAADTLVQVHKSQSSSHVLAVTNPLPAVGGRNLVTSDQARRSGPASLKKRTVAVTAVDYQTAIEEFQDADGRRPIQRAKAYFFWSGSWLTVKVVVEPFGAQTLDEALRQDLLRYLERRRLAGYDLEITQAHYVPFELTIVVTLTAAAPPKRRTDAIRAALSIAQQPGGRGLFHPDNFTFGQNLFVSQIYAAVAAVPGVDSINIVRLARLKSKDPDRDTQNNLKQGFLAIGADEIVRLDNDRNFPFNGVLSIQVREGKR